MTGPSHEYLFGHSATETERLRLQARIFALYTARFLEDAGIVRGMKVLDVGTGAGDVALLLADLVGPEGSVIGVDSNPELVETARARVAEAGLGNVSFVSATRRQSSSNGTSMRSSAVACCSSFPSGQHWSAARFGSARLGSTMPVSSGKEGL